MRTKSSVYNMVVRLSSSIIPSILGVILNNLLLTKFGSDVNGVIATITQVLSYFTLFEGGFTLASNIALYKPYLDNDLSYINDILSTTRLIYLKVGKLIFFIILVASAIVPYLIKSNIDKGLISTLFLISSISLLINFFYYYKYSIMFSVSQQEYRVGLYNVSFAVLSQCAAIGAFFIGIDLIGIRLILLIISLLSIPFITFQHKRRFPYIDFRSETPNYSIVKSSKDVFVQKLASLIFSSTDMVLLSVFVSTITTSVYAVYNMIFVFIKNLLFSVILAPFNAFGQLFAQDKNRDNMWENYKLYSHISFVVICVFLVSVGLVVLPFVSLYTIGVHDTAYADPKVAFMFIICVFLELLSNMTGGLLNSAGKFKEMKSNILIGSILNAVISLLLVKKHGIIGVLWGTMIAYVVMDIMQIRLVFNVVIGKGILHFVVALVYNIIISATILFLGTRRSLIYNSYLDFFVTGFISFLLSGFIILISNWLAFPNEFRAIKSMLGSVLKLKSIKQSSDL